MSVRPVLTIVGLAACLTSTACFVPSMKAERHVQRSFKVAPGATVEIGLAGGNVTTVTGPPGSVSIDMTMRVRAFGSTRSAESMLADINVEVVQEGDVVRVRSERRRGSRYPWWVRSREMVATISVPADVALKLDTRGGRVNVRGDRTADLHADTHGGAVDVEGGRGRLVLSTSGGSIRIRRALGSLQADTRGGSIDVDYVGPTVSDIDLGSSGGSIKVGIDPTARLNVLTSSRGGGIRVDGLRFDVAAAEQSQIEGTLNGGDGGRVRAITHGGSITVRAASDPG